MKNVSFHFLELDKIKMVKMVFMLGEYYSILLRCYVIIISSP